MKYFKTKKQAIESLKNPQKVRYVVWNKTLQKWAAAERMTKAIRSFYDNHSPYEQPTCGINYIEAYDGELT